MAQRVKNLTQCLGAIPGLAASCCRSQMQLRSRVAVAVAVVEAGCCSSDLTPRPGTVICLRCGFKKEGKKKVSAIKGWDRMKGKKKKSTEW